MKEDSNSKKIVLANDNTKSSFEGKKYFFKGDSNHISLARQVAIKLEVETHTENGQTFVTSEDNFKKVTQYLISNKIDGWWHYVSRKEYFERIGLKVE